MTLELDSMRHVRLVTISRRAALRIGFYGFFGVLLAQVALIVVALLALGVFYEATGGSKPRYIPDWLPLQPPSWQPESRPK